MNTLKLIFLALIQSARQAWLLPQTITTASKERRERIARAALETERLDRICNPSKYLGK